MEGPRKGGQVSGWTKSEDESNAQPCDNIYLQVNLVEFGATRFRDAVAKWKWFARILGYHIEPTELCATREDAERAAVEAVKAKLSDLTGYMKRFEA
jgi:hypothetical protein